MQRSLESAYCAQGSVPAIDRCRFGGEFMKLHHRATTWPCAHSVALVCIDDHEDFDPERLRGCAYWRCDEIFEARTINQIFCRKACRSRQRKWERAQERKRLRSGS